MSIHTQSTGAGQTPSEERPANLARSGDLEVRLAVSEDEIIAAQSLRYRIFYDEMKAAPSLDLVRTGRDVDRFDDAADHLLVIDTRETQAARAVVGTYRLIRRAASRDCGGFYTGGDGNRVLPFKTGLFSAADQVVRGRPVTVHPVTIA